MASPKRLQRVVSLVKEEIAEILAREVARDADALLTVTAVEVSPDLLHATVRVSVYPSGHAPTIMAGLAKRVWAIQQTLNERLRMRPVPKIRFVVDRSEAEAEKIEKTLRGLEK